MWRTFEAACEEIASADEAIYGALLAKKETNLPSTGFFDLFKTKRRESFLEITGNDLLEANQLSHDQMVKIAQIERERVHQHAIQNT